MQCLHWIGYDSFETIQRFCGDTMINRLQRVGRHNQPPSGSTDRKSVV